MVGRVEMVAIRLAAVVAGMRTEATGAPAIWACAVLAASRALQGGPENMRIVCVLLILIVASSPSLTVAHAQETAPQVHSVLFSDDFTSPDSGLPVGLEGAGGGRYLSDGYLIPVSFGLATTGRLYDRWADDFSFQADVYLLQGGSDVEAGLAFRDDGEHGYFFGVHSCGWDLGRYKSPWQGDLSATNMNGPIAKGQPSACDSTNKPHRLAVSASGAKLKLYVGDHQVWEGTDVDPGAPTGGRFGFRTVVYATDGATAGFANAVVQNPEASCGLTAHARATDSSVTLRGAGFAADQPVTVGATLGNEMLSIDAVADADGQLALDVQPTMAWEGADGFLVTADSDTCTARVSGRPAPSRILFQATLDPATESWTSSAGAAPVMDRGRLLLESSGTPTVARPMASNVQSLADLDVQAVVTLVGGPANARTGLRFRESGSGEDPNVDDFMISDDSFTLLKRTGDQVTTLAPSNSKAYIRKRGDPNVIRFVAKGSSITLFVNGWQVATVTEDAPQMGAIGVVADQGAQIAVQDLRVSTVAP